MKYLLASLTLVLTLIVSSSTINAAHFWKIQMSDPSTAAQSRAFNLDFTTLSTDKNDVITVSLLENGTIIDSSSTIPGGDSGSFFVTVPADGTYTYNLSATSSNDGATKTTNSKAVTVSTPQEGAPSQVTVTEASATNATSGATPDGSSLNEDGDGESEGATDEGQVEGVIDEAGGTVDGQAAVDDKSGEDDSNTLIYILALLALVGAGAYGARLYRANRTEE
jgi:hypothetical protein